MKIRLLVAMTALACSTAAFVIPDAWLHVPQAPQYDAGNAPRAVAANNVHIIQSPDGAKLADGDKILTPAFRAIDSFDVSLDRKEIVFSAKRNKHFDVGLVSIDGSDILVTVAS